MLSQSLKLPKNLPSFMAGFFLTGFGFGSGESAESYSRVVKLHRRKRKGLPTFPAEFGVSDLSAHFSTFTLVIN